MSRATRRRTRALAGGALAVVASLVAAPAQADTAGPSTGATAAPSATTPAADPSGPSATTAPTSPSAPTASPTTDPTPPAAPTGGPTSSPTSPTSPGTPTGSPTAAPATAVTRAAAYLVRRLTDGTHVVGPYGPDLGQTADAALALAAVPGQPGGQPAGRQTSLMGVTDYLASQAEAYVQGDTSQGEKAGAAYAGPTGKLAVVAAVTGRDPRAFGGVDLVAQLQGLLVTSGPQAGRFFDDSAFGDYSNPLGQGFDVLALERAGVGAPQSAVDYLVGAQCADGGFPDAFGARTCVSSPDATGLVLQALIAADADCAASRALAWLQQARSASGSWASNAADTTKAPVASINSTAYAALGLAAAASSTVEAVGYLTSVQNADGGLPAAPGTSTTSDLYATAQAVPALAGASLLSLGADPVLERRPRCTDAGPTASPSASASPSPTASPTASATASPAPTATPSPSAPTTSALPAPGQPTAAPSSPTPSSPPTATALAAPGAPTSSGAGAGVSIEAPPVSGEAAGAAEGQLAQTGTDVLVPVSVGAALVFLGLLLLFLGRRRGGRHA